MKIAPPIIILLLLTSCGSKVEKERLPGLYVWNDGRTDTLEIRTDGTYEYWMFLPGRKVAHSGTWKFNSVMNEIEFERENFPFLKNHSSDGSWFSQIKIKNNELLLMNGIDNNFYLREVKPLVVQ